MTHRYAAAFALLVMALAPVQAWAECAWVLWEEEHQTPRHGRTIDRLDPLGAYDTRRECDVALLDHLDLRRGMLPGSEPEHRERGWHKVEKKRSVASIGPLGEFFVYAFRCLPDTIDPRGAKGGGR